MYDNNEQNTTIPSSSYDEDGNNGQSWRITISNSWIWSGIKAIPFAIGGWISSFWNKIPNFFDSFRAKNKGYGGQGYNGETTDEKTDKKTRYNGEGDNY